MLAVLATSVITTVAIEMPFNKIYRIYFGMCYRVQKLLDAAKYSYILPTHRATIYLIGVCMAYFLRNKKFDFTLSKTQARLLWVVCFALAAVTIASPYRMGLAGYQYEHAPAAIFAAFSPHRLGIVYVHYALGNL
ncbi:hypothetical protein MSG28_001397 [Choristoneura fumiferana]|uniref:Uncharacterized protein n=1 Tax=Choristoneura fumiferana TaxID=7141 RepID=A0ACC0KTL7_CHOFU|nr:hypothetical protein MSG28_001397 [Choristoneura fumiferana]